MNDQVNFLLLTGFILNVAVLVIIYRKGTRQGQPCHKIHPTELTVVYRVAREKREI